MSGERKMTKLEETARRLLNERGVTIEDIAELVMYLQKNTIPTLQRRNA